MLEKIEHKIKNILSIVKLCPLNLQEKCFEVLLTAMLNDQTYKLPDSVRQQNSSNQSGVVNGKNKELESKDSEDIKQEEIKLNEIHLKAKKLLEQGLTLDEINNIFYREDGDLKPVFDDLKSSKMSESQIKLALIEALRNAILIGDFKFDTKYIRQQCDTYKCFDSLNFSTNFKKQKGLFNEEYKKDITMSLNSEGKKELIKVIKELAL